MLIGVREDRNSYGSFSCINQGSQTAQTPGGKGVRIQAEDFGHSGTKHLRISGSTCFKLLDVGLSKLCPKANSQLRFARGLQVKTEILHTKVIRGKVVEETELIHVHCFTTQDFVIKSIKLKDNLSQPFKTNLFQNHCKFWDKFKVFECHWLVSHQKWHQPSKFKF